MKVWIAVDNNNGLDSLIGNRFGRTGYFLIYDMAGDTIVAIEKNAFLNDAQGVGIKIASLVIEKGCRATIGPQPGPKAEEILAHAGIKILIADKGTAGQAIERYRSELTE
ncbi:MAG: dinitrogenase iron-molybdenum cofactor biosynthesis protein [Acidobacteria bacterium]|jgi:predicted Fe-Mo cluster-binding NifX family protein|nr:dinitrogenase iron-molybdenum cofactor biosynthesis protein [Acidobacteriota bacterium]